MENETKNKKSHKWWIAALAVVLAVVVVVVVLAVCLNQNKEQTSENMSVEEASDLIDMVCEDFGLIEASSASASISANSFEYKDYNGEISFAFMEAFYLYMMSAKYAFEDESLVLDTWYVCDQDYSKNNAAIENSENYLMFSISGDTLKLFRGPNSEVSLYCEMDFTWNSNKTGWTATIIQKTLDNYEGFSMIYAEASAENGVIYKESITYANFDSSTEIKTTYALLGSNFNSAYIYDCNTSTNKLLFEGTSEISSAYENCETATEDEVLEIVNSAITNTNSYTCLTISEFADKTCLSCNYLTHASYQLYSGK